MSAEAIPALETQLDRQQFRRVLGRFATGITIPTVLGPHNQPHGLTANSFTSVSMSPPLISVCVDHRAKILEYFRAGGHFGVNVLHASQRELSDRFAGSGFDRFEGIAWTPGRTGVPLLPDALAHLECRVFQTVTAGDHDILIGQVIHAAFQDGEPLVFFASQYRTLR